MSLTQERIHTIAIEAADKSGVLGLLFHKEIFDFVDAFLSCIREEQEAAAEVFSDSYPDHTATMYVNGQFLKEGTKLFTIPPASDPKEHDCKELVEALKKIIAISDRKHDAWDSAKEIIAKHEASMGEK